MARQRPRNRCGKPSPRRARPRFVLGAFATAAAAAVLVALRQGAAFVSAPYARPGAAQGGRVGRLPARDAKQGSPQVDSFPDIADVETVLEEAEFWRLLDESKVQEAIMLSWSGRRLLTKLTDGSFAAVNEETDPEDLRERILKAGVVFRYPSGDSLTEEEALRKQEFGSEGAVASGVATAAAIGLLDTVLEIGTGGAVLVGGGGSGAVVGQSVLEGESPGQVISEDLGILKQDFLILEKAAENSEKILEADARMAGQFASQEAAQAQLALQGSESWLERVGAGLVKNHAPGVGGVVEDSFMALLVAVSLFSLWKQTSLKRKSSSWSGFAHTATGAMQIGIVLYAIIEERCLRESPGPVWAIFTFIIFMVNNVTMWPLLKYFRGPEVYRVLFKLAYSFIISFQGIHCIAFSSQYPWLYWLVMPFWFYSVKKLVESSDNIFALLPEGSIPKELQDSAKRRVKGLQSDTTTIVYSILNFGGAVFDNLYMAVYTWRGPAGFWGWSQENIPGVNDHLRTALVKPAFGSLTISVLVFLGTLVYRKQMNDKIGIGLNVILASIGPWLILYYHKLIDWDEPWQPEISGDWGSTPYFVSHFQDLPALLMVPLALVGSGKAIAAVASGTGDPAAAPVAATVAAAAAPDAAAGLVAASATEVFDPAQLLGALPSAPAPASEI